MSEDDKLLKEAKKLPWEERLAHKNWKVRIDANIDMASVCDGIRDPKDPRLKDLGPLFKKTVADSNAPCQEKALDALISYLRASDTDASRYAQEICDSVVLKCLTGRPKTLEKSQAVFLLWVELEAADAFLDAMEKAVKAKLAKAVVPAIDAMYQSVSAYGTTVVPPKRIMKMLPDLFDHPDQNVRACAKGLTIELCRWIGKDDVKHLLFDKMRDTMKKELESEVENVIAGSKPTRRIRSDQALGSEQLTVASVATVRPVHETAPTGSLDIDKYDSMDPVDILTPLGKSGFWDGVKAEKWSERRDTVAELTRLSSVKIIANGDFSEVSQVLKKLVTDVNIAVGVEAVRAIGNLASGLRKNFGSASRLLLPVLLDKLKEKKQVMADALTSTLNSMHKSGCILLQDVVEDVKVATRNKVPSVRSLCLTWVATCIESSNKPTVLKLHKEYVPILVECLDDGSPEVRHAAFLALVAFAKVVGMKVLEKPLENLDDMKRKKLIQQIGPESNGSAPAAPVLSKTQADINGSSNKNVVEKGDSKRSAASPLSGKRDLPVSPAPKKSGAAGASRLGTAKKSDPTKAQGAKTQGTKAPGDGEPGEMSLEEIELRVGPLFEAEVITNMKSTSWKERLEAMNSLKDTIEVLKEIDQYAELLIRLLSVSPCWNEKNVQIQQQAIEAVTLIARNTTLLSKDCVVLCLAKIVEKLTDIKTRTQATICLNTFCEAVGPEFVFEQLFEVMKDHKNPKVLCEGLSWMATALENFGVGHIPINDLINFCKVTGMGSSAIAAKTATIKLFGVLHRFVGPDLKGSLNDVKPHLQLLVDAEIEQNPFEGPVSIPNRAIQAEDVGAPASETDGQLQEDISDKLTASLLRNMSCVDWKVRQESLECLIAIIEEANNRIQPTGTGELFMSLKARLNDSNKNLVMMTLATLGTIATAIGPTIDKHSKGILADALKCLGDSKKVVREAVIKMLDSWVLVLQLDKMLPYVIPALGNGKICVEGRRSLFEWVARHVRKYNDRPALLQLVRPISLGLQDKSIEVRKVADACLVEIIRAFDLDPPREIDKRMEGKASEVRVWEARGSVRQSAIKIRAPMEPHAAMLPEVAEAISSNI